MLVSVRYRPRESWIETLDPRARWIFSFCFLFAAVSFWDIRFLLFFLIISIANYALAKLTWQETRRFWLLISFVIGTMVLLNTIITGAGTIGSVMSGGHPIFEFDGRFPLFGWPVHYAITIERLWFALSQLVRTFSIALIFAVIPYTMDPRIYGITFRRMGLPDRLAFTFDLAFRFVPTLARDFSTTLDAQRARGYEIERAEGGLITQVRRVAPLVVPVTMSSILTGEDVANAMDLRCFGLRKRTWIEVLHYHWTDFAVIASGVLLLIGSLVLSNIFHIGGFWVPAWLLP